MSVNSKNSRWMVGWGFSFLLLTLVLWDRPSFSSQRSDLTSQTVGPLSQIQVIHFHASWCGTCLKHKKNRWIKFALLMDFQMLILCQLILIKSLSLRKVYNVSSTIDHHLLKKGQEVDRLMAESRVDKLKHFIAKQG